MKGYPESYSYRDDVRNHIIKREYSDGTVRTVAKISRTIPKNMIEELINKLNDELAK